MDVPAGSVDPERPRVKARVLRMPRISTPVAHWWDNVIHACASFEPFRTEEEIDAWCARHALPRGATLSIPALWEFARDWYGAYLQEPWRKRSTTEARELFQRHSLTSSFWAVG